MGAFQFAAAAQKKLAQAVVGFCTVSQLLAPEWSITDSHHPANAACLELKSRLGDAIILRSEDSYTTLSEINWSATAWSTPACIVRTGEVPQLQDAIRVLVQQDVKFAIRAGGHSPSPGGANIDNEILIDTSLFNEVVYDAANSVATIGAGQTWREVYTRLDAHKVTVVGGRVLDVGVAGLILGGGLSWLSDLYGMPCDNIVSMNVVLPNSSSIEASENSHAELFWAMKGGANNFGIVTSFTLSAYPIHNVWGGFKFYALEHLPALFSAVLEYQTNPEKDLYANMMLQAFTTNETVGAVLNTIYLKPEASPAAFKPFYDIPTVADTTKLQTLQEMMSGQPIPPLSRWDWFSSSFTPSATLYAKIVEIVTTSSKLDEIKSAIGGSMAIGLQPINPNLIRQGKSRGGNPMGLQERVQSWFVLDSGWELAGDDAKVHGATKEINERILSEVKRQGEVVEYLFMNDASWDQDVIASYGEENVRKMKEVQNRYDPEGTFRRLVPGGFKII